MLTDFYVAFSTVCFTLLGLWIIVVQTRHAEWRRSVVHRRRAYGVALHFSLPGLMSLLWLIRPAPRCGGSPLPSWPPVAFWPWFWCGVPRQRGWARRRMWPPWCCIC